MSVPNLYIIELAFFLLEDVCLYRQWGSSCMYAVHPGLTHEINRECQGQILRVTERLRWPRWPCKSSSRGRVMGKLVMLHSCTSTNPERSSAPQLRPISHRFIEAMTLKTHAKNKYQNNFQWKLEIQLSVRVCLTWPSPMTFMPV